MPQVTCRTRFPYRSAHRTLKTQAQNDNNLDFERGESSEEPFLQRRDAANDELMQGAQCRGRQGRESHGEAQGPCAATGRRPGRAGGPGLCCWARRMMGGCQQPGGSSERYAVTRCPRGRGRTCRLTNTTAVAVRAGGGRRPGAHRWVNANQPRWTRGQSLSHEKEGGGAARRKPAEQGALCPHETSGTDQGQRGRLPGAGPDGAVVALPGTACPLVGTKRSRIRPS